MSLEQKLLGQYRKNAKIADMGGYGLSGGSDDGMRAAQDMYSKELMSLDSKGMGLSGGRRKRRKAPKEVEGGFFPGASIIIPAVASLVSSLLKKGGNVPGLSGGGSPMVGHGQSGGIQSGGMTQHRGMPMGYPERYPGSFPMPGFYPGGQDGYQGNIGSGLSGGGRMKKSKNPNRVAAGKKSASGNSWLSRVAEYRKSHGVSQKEAMIALGRGKK